MKDKNYNSKTTLKPAIQNMNWKKMIMKTHIYLSNLKMLKIGKKLKLKTLMKAVS